MVTFICKLLMSVCGIIGSLLVMPSEVQLPLRMQKAVKTLQAPEASVEPYKRIAS